MKEIEIENASVETAIEEGLKKLGLKKEEVEIKILDEGIAGLFGINGSKLAKVRLRSKQIEGAKIEGDLSNGAQIEGLRKKTREILSKLMELMGLDCDEISVSAENGVISAEVNGADKKLLIGRNGQTISALQLILPLLALGKHRNENIRVNLDVDGYCKEKSAKIAELAKQSAEDVIKSGQTKYLEPMSSRERMIVHLALKGIEGVTTVSEGEGDTRRVLIKLK